MKAMALVNPAAGGGHAGRHAATVLQRFGELDVRTTVGPGHATALVREARSRGVQRFLSVGGDGTLHEVASGVMQAEGPVPVLGICPLGTGNSFGRDIDVRDLDAAAAAWNGDHRRPVDLLHLEHDDEDDLYAINLVGLGFSAAAGSLTNRRFKRLGAGGYIAAVLVELARLKAPSLSFTLDGAAHDGPAVMLSICNSRYTGGDMQMAPQARIDDGKLDVIRLGPVSRARFLTAFPKIFAGTHPTMPEVLQAQGSRVELALAGPVEVMIDGEVRRMGLTAVQVVPRAVEVLCPR